MLQPIIDLHHHAFPAEFIEAISKKGMKNKIVDVILALQWDLKKDLAFMDELGIQTAFVSVLGLGDFLAGDIAFARDLSRLGNEYCAKLMQNDPQRYGAFATLPLPDLESALKELEYALDVLKLDGVILSSNYEGYYLGDPRFDELFSELNRRKAVVFIHPDTPAGIDMTNVGFNASLVDYPHDTTRVAVHLVLNGVLAKYPDIRFILSHAGGTLPYLMSRITGAEGIVYPHKNFPHSIEYYFKQFFYDTALTTSPSTFACLHSLVDTSQIVYGSDYPFRNTEYMKTALNGLRSVQEFDENALESIQRGNAIHLFPRLMGMNE